MAEQRHAGPPVPPLPRLPDYVAEMDTEELARWTARVALSAAIGSHHAHAAAAAVAERQTEMLRSQIELRREMQARDRLARGRDVAISQQIARLGGEISSMRADQIASDLARAKDDLERERLAAELERVKAAVAQSETDAEDAAKWQEQTGRYNLDDLARRAREGEELKARLAEEGLGVVVTKARDEVSDARALRAANRKIYVRASAAIVSILLLSAGVIAAILKAKYGG